jgi:hypothetical protein
MDVFESLLLGGTAQIPADIIEDAQYICTQGILTGVPPGQTSDPLAPTSLDLPDLTPGRPLVEKVERLHALHYRLTVDEALASRGFLIHCESAARDRFKIMLFDTRGAMIEQDDCVRSSDGRSTQSVLYFNCCPTFRLGSSPVVPPSPGGVPAKETEGSAARLRASPFTPSTKRVAPGQYLVAVLGDNSLGRTSYRLVALPFSARPETTAAVAERDTALVSLRAKAEELMKEYDQVIILTTLH